MVFKRIGDHPMPFLIVESMPIHIILYV